MIHHTHMEIKCGNGRLAIVDKEDYELLSRFSWQSAGNTGHVFTIISNFLTGGKSICLRMHTLIMGGRLVDHINCNPLDNRKSNLRFCTFSQNMCNVRKFKRPCTSKYKGVSKKKNGKWLAYISRDKKRYSLGTYEREEEAALAYDRKAREIHGEFGRFNFPIHEGEQNANWN